MFPMGESIGVPDSEGVRKEYAICTRQRRGLYTVDGVLDSDEDGVTQCLVVDEHGMIANVGNIDNIKASHPHIRPRFLPKNAIVVPGLVDSHVHFLEYGWSRALNLDGLKGVEDVVTAVRKYILERDIQRNSDQALQKPLEWIEGVGWDQNKWDNWKGGFPTHDMLDADPVLRGKPIILFRTDLHAVWLSGRALELCGELPTEVEGGEIIRDENGKPTGIFLDNAQTLVPRPPWSDRQMRSYFKTAVHEVLRLGITAVHDAMTREPVIDFYKRIADEGVLPIRMYLMAFRDSGYWGDDVPKFHHYGKDQRLHLRSVKLLSDGAIGSWGAAMYEPYTDNPSTSGFFVMSLKDLQHDIPQYIERGWQVNVHCIGDKANGEVLDVFEKALKNKDTNALRPRIEHAQILRPQDIQRFAKLNLIASVQPKHATSDMVYADARLGDRVKSSYAYRSFIDTGARIALGSDMPVESPDPLVTFHAAVTRVNATGDSPQGPGGWYPEQKLTKMQTLKGMTLDAAYASFTEHEVGNLVVGKRADFVVLDKDIMKIDAQEILDTKVLATVVDGIVQYGAL
ncbi:hypothetical protein CPB86DRAFT_807752 [Serendipita vermifera]|nr:hypothetical protein CPB86DRAFT_807752 [Serendipita vermifera]